MSNNSLYVTILGMSQAELKTTTNAATGEDQLNFNALCRSIDNITDPSPKVVTAAFNKMCENLEGIVTAPRRGRMKVRRKKRPVAYVL